MSGSLMSAKTHGRLVVEDTKKWARKLCPMESSQLIKECLKKKTLDELYGANEATVINEEDIDELFFFT